ncbi:MAG: class I SAM-dependent methyltransferase [Alphaproteobacteria bacterium]|nr:class I SAM-dependent methyltransferase [Alphaproteobacteria bacterium]
MPALSDRLAAALDRRAALRDALHAEDTTAYRLFHGAVEGWPGLSVDRYGPVLLAQSFRAPPAREDVAAVEALAARLGLWPVFNHRGEGEAALPAPPPEALADHVVTELGLRYRFRARHRGLDPWLFLDLRAGRRWVKAHAQGAEVLNLFAYTCGVGVAAAAGGARRVTNLDFAASALEVGCDNADLNGITEDRFATIQADALPALRQLAGLPLKGRARRRRRFRRLAPQQFDLVVLDPPTWATSPWGAIDPVRDYPALFKPALLCTRPGGRLLVTNHVSTVPLEEWLGVLERCAQKAGRPLQGVEVLTPEADFPSPDGRPPLKLAVVGV